MCELRRKNEHYIYITKKIRQIYASSKYITVFRLQQIVVHIVVIAIHNYNRFCTEKLDFTTFGVPTLI